MRIDPISVAFVLPCLNEARTIEWCVARAVEALTLVEQTYGLSGEVIVADNGSTDGSQALAEAAGARVVAVPEKGYGAALMGGFRDARAQYLVMGDSDCSYDFVEALPMIGKLLDGADLCMGSRFKGEIKPGAMPWKNRYIGNPVLSGILRLLYRTRISDAHCGLRALTRTAFDRMKLSSTGMEFASEMVLKSALMKMNVAEVPVTLSPDKRGRPPHLNPWRDGLRHLIYMFLLSPGWLFMLPAALMFAAGALLLGLLVGTDGSEPLRLGGFRFGDHWAIVASGALIMSTQTALMGLFALVYGYREGYRKPGRLAEIFLRRSRLQYWLLAGMIVMGVGFGFAIWIAVGWAESGFGSLNALRSLLAASTAIVIGAQIFFSGFLLSIVAGNRSRLAAVL
ncbi:MAG: glycosyltransferase family 2 protein [Tabrizicola sp.]|nr:glycosyltransferase family 2 protein [Tabrizicola sp.]